VKTDCFFPAGKLSVTSRSWSFTYVYNRN
jgi:hypothetical protein